MKLFVVVQSALSAGLKMAQALHAFRQFVEDHRDIEAQWFRDHNNIVVLQHDNVPSLADRLAAEGFHLSRFHEPDLDGELTALCVEPAAWRQLSDTPLAR